MGQCCWIFPPGLFVVSGTYSNTFREPFLCDSLDWELVAFSQAVPEACRPVPTKGPRIHRTMIRRSTLFLIMDNVCACGLLCRKFYCVPAAPYTKHENHTRQDDIGEIVSHEVLSRLAINTALTICLPVSRR